MTDDIKSIWRDLSDELLRSIKSKVSNIQDAEDILQVGGHKIVHTNT